MMKFVLAFLLLQCFAQVTYADIEELISTRDLALRAYHREQIVNRQLDYNMWLDTLFGGDFTAIGPLMEHFSADVYAWQTRLVTVPNPPVPAINESAGDLTTWEDIKTMYLYLAEYQFTDYSSHMVHMAKITRSAPFHQGGIFYPVFDLVARLEQDTIMLMSNGTDIVPFPANVLGTYNNKWKIDADGIPRMISFCSYTQKIAMFSGLPLGKAIFAA